MDYRKPDTPTAIQVATGYDSKSLLDSSSMNHVIAKWILADGEIVDPNLVSLNVMDRKSCIIHEQSFSAAEGIVIWQYKHIALAP